MRLSCIPRDTASESYCDIMSLSLVKERPRFFNLIFCIFADDQELILGTICHLLPISVVARRHQRRCCSRRCSSTGF